MTTQGSWLHVSRGQPATAYNYACLYNLQGDKHDTYRPPRLSRLFRLRRLLR